MGVFSGAHCDPVGCGRPVSDPELQVAVERLLSLAAQSRTALDLLAPEHTHPGPCVRCHVELRRTQATLFIVIAE